MKVRPGTWDAKIATQVLKNNEYGLPDDMTGMVIVDIGAHIGSFALACAQRNAKAVFCYEADPENFALLEQNIAEYSGSTVFGLNSMAVVGNARPQVRLRRLKDHDGTIGRNTGHVDIYGSDDESNLSVATIRIVEVLRDAGKVDLLKMDCEGAEWELFDFASLHDVKEIVAELHLFNGLPREALIQKLRDNLEEDLFKDINIAWATNSQTGFLRATKVANPKVEVKNGIPKLLWIGDAVIPTGYGRVTKEICTGLMQAGWDVHVFGLGYMGDPHDLPFKVYPALDFMPQRSMTKLRELIGNLNPDFIVLQDDSWNVGIFLDSLAMMNIGTPVVAYVAVDSENVRKDVARQLNSLQHLICHTQFAASELIKAGYKGDISVAGHGIDSDLYQPYDKMECREGIQIAGWNPKEAFIWGSVAVNQPRKRLDLTVAYFAKWWEEAGKPKDAYLYLHTNRDGVWDLKQLADFCGVKNQVIGTTTQLADDQLPAVYNAFDVLMSTAEGESFGLTHLESMSCGIPNLAVRCGGLPSWAEDKIMWVDPSYYTFNPLFGGEKHANSLRWIASEKDYVAAMNQVYCDQEMRKYYSIEGRKHAMTFKWTNVSAHFDKVLKDLLQIRQKASSSGDTLAEFA